MVYRIEVVQREYTSLYIKLENWPLGHGHNYPDMHKSPELMVTPKWSLLTSRLPYPFASISGLKDCGVAWPCH